MGSLLAFARKQPGFGREFEVANHAFQIGSAPLDAYLIAQQLAERSVLKSLDLIAVAAYAWSERVVAPLMDELRNRGFAGDYLVGGYQVTPDVVTSDLYPAARWIVEGPGERALIRALLERPPERLLTDGVSMEDLVSPYLTGVIDVPHGTTMVRMETQRGCRWRCSFCSYGGTRAGQILPVPQERVYGEIELFAARGVKKVNILDPEFNGTRRCLSVLRRMREVGLQSRVTAQVRLENLVRAPWGTEFMDLAAGLDFHMEFGLQTAVAAESEAVNRRNDYDAVARALEALQRRDQSFEVSMIYGLPLQTVESFAESLEFLRRHGVPTVRCFPLMLHRGTRLSRERERYAIVEEVIDEFGIAFVTGSSTFSRRDWEEMRRMAQEAMRSSIRPPVRSERVEPHSTAIATS
ncbi:radical SAM protein [uncultured Lamprocystis sp.]|uniref:B12-binding domain-containing radical SAM protein n=1 Tax=uncultured Lamprocystis sp. TaxID=543132 RepID=UPI0025ECC57A|nr:radical SAM protein [uncultured Lamprocystis sp.]